MITVFPIIVLTYFSFCCHSSHSLLCCNRLVYSCFVLFLKVTATLIKTLLVSYLFFLICLFSVSVYILFFYLYNLTFLISDCILFFLYTFCLSCYLVFIRSVFPVTLSLLLFCLSSCIVFMSFCLFLFCLSFFCLYVILSILCHSVSFHVFVALPLPPIFSLILASFLPFHLFIF